MPINRWAESVDVHDSVLTFNYDTLVERALAGAGKTWNHGRVEKATTGSPYSSCTAPLTG